jgi:general secretion pathway protein E
MNIESYLLSSSIVGVLAQRLVRKICPHCKISYIPEDQELKELQLEKKQLDQGRLWKGAGCRSCFGTGYKGRRGIYELCLVTPLMKKQIVKSLDSAEIRKIALSQGMLELYQDGISLLLEGRTTSAELLRVTRISLEGQGE